MQRNPLERDVRQRRSRRGERRRGIVRIARQTRRHEEVGRQSAGVQDRDNLLRREGIGGDGLMPARDLGREYFRYDETAQTLVGEETGTTYAAGQRLRLRLAEANPVSGALRFELLPEDRDTARARKPARPIKRRGRPGNIRHQGKRR